MRARERAILFVLTNSALNRGMNTGLENLAWGLAQRGVRVHILAGGEQPGYHNYYIPDAVSYHFTGWSGKNPTSFLSRFEDIVRDYGIDVVVGWIINTALLANSPSAEGIRFVANLGQMPPKSVPLLSLKWALLRRMGALEAFRLNASIRKYPSIADAVVSISSAVQSTSVQKYSLKKNKCQIIPRGVDTNIFSFGRPNENVYSPVKILFAGNIQDAKGVGDLVRALCLVRTPVALRLCGRGKDGYILQLREALRETPHKIEYMGPVYQRELVKFYQQSDIFTFPSHSEGLGKALLEAMSCGCPVISSDIPVFKEVVQHGQNGLMVPVRAPQILAGAIEELIADRALRERCSVNARKTIEERFSKKLEIDQWMKVLDFGSDFEYN